MYQCCFCGRAIDMRRVDVVTLSFGIDDGGSQTIYSHVACLSESVHPSVPLAVNTANGRQMTAASAWRKAFRLFGKAVMVFGIVLLGRWWISRDTDPHGAVFLFGGGALIVMVGLLIWAIGYSKTMRGPGV